MKKEISLRHNELQDTRLNSIYLGGGTPSLLSVEEINDVFEHLNHFFSWENKTEITLEANPEDLSPTYLKKLIHTPINRLSIGIQSFDDRELNIMNRHHTGQEAISSVLRSQDTGIENINIDLIYGSQLSGIAHWKKQLDQSFRLQPKHISAYALTVEEKTVLAHQIKKKKILPPSEDFQQMAFFILSEYAEAKGYRHYEISNYALQNFESKHNSAYWKGKEYLGIGPSAHSYNGERIRSWNQANNASYMKILSENRLPIEREELCLEDQYNERLMIGLRTREGVDLEKIERDFGKEYLSYLRESMREVDSLIWENNRLYLPEDKWFLADGIAARLFRI